MTSSQPFIEWAELANQAKNGVAELFCPIDSAIRLKIERGFSEYNTKMEVLLSCPKCKSTWRLFFPLELRTKNYKTRNLLLPILHSVHEL